MQIRAKKSLGQNWLSNPRILDKIVDAAEINNNDIVVEVGPGTGNLTEKIAEKIHSTSSGQAGTLIAIEKDHRLIEDLKEKYKNNSQVKIIEDDILELDPVDYKLEAGSYKIVGNIPYYITSNFIRIVFEKWPQPQLIVLMIQKEVAQRILAKPPHTNLLALSVQYYCDPKIISYVSKNNFQPVPKIDSAIIRLRPRTGDKKDSAKMFDLMRIGFSEKRKQLAPVLSKKLKIPKEKVAEALEKEGIRGDARPENLSLEDWAKLQENLNT